MVRDFCGSTLWDIMCKKLGDIELPTEQKWVSVHEEELKEIASHYDVSIYERSYESANSNFDVAKIWEICGHVPFEHYIMVNPCLPLLKTVTIEEFIQNFVYSDYSSMFGVSRIQDYFWDENGELFHPKGTTILETNSCPPLWMARHALYGGRTRDICNGIQMGDFTKDNPALFMMDSKIECLDIDTKEDLIIAEAVYKFSQERGLL